MSYQLWKFLPSIPMGILTSIFWRCELAYSRNAKIANAEILKSYFTYNFSTSGFELPLPCDFGKG